MTHSFCQGHHSTSAIKPGNFPKTNSLTLKMWHNPNYGSQQGSHRPFVSKLPFLHRYFETFIQLVVFLSLLNLFLSIWKLGSDDPMGAIRHILVVGWQHFTSCSQLSIGWISYVQMSLDFCIIKRRHGTICCIQSQDG